MQILESVGPEAASLAVAVLCLIFASPTIWSNLWYLIVTPFFSVRANAEDDHPVFTVFLLLAGGYLFNAGVAWVYPQLDARIHEYWVSFVESNVTSPNQQYIETARSSAIGQLESSVLPGPLESNLLLIPLGIILLWLLGNLVFWLLSQLSSSDTGLGTFYQIIAYPFFLFWTGQGLLVAGAFSEASQVVNFAMLGLGGVITLWSVLITIFAYYRAMQAPAVVFVIFVLLGLGVWGAAIYYGAFERVIAPEVDTIIQEWNSYHPERVDKPGPERFLARHS